MSSAEPETASSLDLDSARESQLLCVYTSATAAATASLIPLSYSLFTPTALPATKRQYFSRFHSARQTAPSLCRLPHLHQLLFPAIPAPPLPFLHFVATFRLIPPLASSFFCFPHPRPPNRLPSHIYSSFYLRLRFSASTALALAHYN